MVSAALEHPWLIHNVITDFSSVLTKGQIEDMATADEFEVVKEVQVRTFLQQRTAGTS
jgi:hypothetical protein